MNCLHLSQIACQIQGYDIVNRMVQASLLQTIPLRGLCPRISAPKPARSSNAGTICREPTLTIKDFTYIFAKVHLVSVSLVLTQEGPAFDAVRMVQKPPAWRRRHRRVCRAAGNDRPEKN